MVRRSHAQANIDGGDEAPAGKRVKVEEPAPPNQPLDDVAQPQPAPQPFGPQHEELWLRDGNFIVVAKEMSFKVHASVLERHSSVFRELLEGPQPGGGPAEVVEGCRVLRVLDWGADLARLLDIMYDGGPV